MILSVLLSAVVGSATAVSDTLAPLRPLREARAVAVGSTASLGGTPGAVVSRGAMQRRGLVGLAEALRGMSGLNVRDYGGIGGLKTVGIRGFGAQHTGIAYDGVVVANAQNGQVDIGRYGLEHLQSIRLDIGGSDDIFRCARLSGSAGTLVLTSQRPVVTDSVPIRGNLQVRYGSYATWHPRASAECRLSSRWQLGGWGDYLRSRGDYPFLLQNASIITRERRLNSQVSNFSGELNAYGNLSVAGDVQFKVHVDASSRGLPGSVILYTQHPTEHLWDRTLSLSAQHRWRSNRWRTQAVAAYSRAWNRYTDSDPLLPAPEDDRYCQHEFSISSVALCDLTRFLQCSFAEDVVVSHLWSSIPESCFPTRESSFTSLSMRYACPRFSLVASGLGLLSFEQTRTVEASPFRYRFTPSLSASWKVLSRYDWRLRASYRDSYRLPTFNDLYYLRVGNRNLRPERARQLNIGTTCSASARGHQVVLTADAYHNSIRDRITAIPTLFIWHMRNVGRVTMWGTDATAAYRSAPFRGDVLLDVSLGYSWQYAIDVTRNDAKNFRHQIPYVPRHSGTASATLLTPWLNLNYRMSASGARYCLAQNLPVYRLAPYADHGLSLNRTFEWRSARQFRLHLSAEVLNLAGRNYEVIKYYPMPGRQWRITTLFAF